ncbi:hypothetical protein LTR78_006354 [Recurvomyces mirabilis]|uniref:Uncharacterized protein n=1 Tax=Recurvomyces mirabilis TaxID=574656 RepID=A0AAE0WLB1_9PEZI|nr:hypothetical protein LTR78_006354 [Recurvomyces mirabilis]KAK5152242.1 hypothetical protein LTS14_008618 [Recurvomyces mirabilis]
MKFTLSTILALLATTTAASPVDLNTLTTMAAEAAADTGETFHLEVTNNCPFVKEVGLYTVTSDFQMLQMSPPTNMPPGHEIVIAAPFKAIGMRLTGHAEWGSAGGWKPQALFEFGYAAYQDVEGTAYDLSLMEGSDHDIGMSAAPVENGQGSGTCRSLKCYPWDCPGNQGWLDPNQSDVGDAAPDTVCYKGKTDFKIVYCP